ncbi:S-protein homolog 21 [Linum perenne]
MRHQTMSKIVMAVILGAILTTSPAMATKFQINVSNMLSNDRKLSVHCQSKDTNLGSRRLAVGEIYGWSFSRNIFGKTLFWCNLSCHGGHNRLSFNSYDESQGKGMKPVYEINWVLKDDGLYYHDKESGMEMLVAPWMQQ